MVAAQVFWNNELAGVLTQHHAAHYTFEYNSAWLANPEKPAISLTLPKSQARYEANQLFPFFFNMLSEGANRKLQSRLLKIDENDHFGLLLATATVETIGAVTVATSKDCESYLNGYIY